MEKEIKKVAFWDVHPLVETSYEAFYGGAMRKTLGEELILLFAPMRETKSSRSWYQPSGVKGKFKSITEAPNELQGLLCVLWERTKAEIEQKIKDLPSVGNLQKITEVPDTSYIYYSEVAGAENDVPAQRFRLLITGWACEVGNPKDKGKDVATNKKVEAENNHQDVTLRMIDEKGQPMANTAFSYLKTDNNVYREFQTDDNGEYKIVLALVHSVFTCEYKLTGQKRTFEVQKNIPVYTLQFAPFVDATVKVVNQHAEPQPNIELKASYGNQSLTAVTDGLGQTTLHDLLYLGDNILMHIAAQTPEAEAIDVKVESTSSQNNYTLCIHTKDPMNVTLLVLLDGVPAPNYSVRIDSAGNTAVYASNEQGIIPLPFLKDQDVFNATSSQDEQQTERYQVEYGTDQYVFNVKSHEEPIEPTPPTPEPEEPKPTRTLIVKDSSGNPVPYFMVRLTHNGQAKDVQTNAEGKIQLPSEWMVGDKFKVTPLSEVPSPKANQSTMNVKAAEPKSDADDNDDIEIEDGKQDYEYVLPIIEPELSRYVLIVDTVNNPVPFYALQLSYNGQLLNNGATISDAKGQIPLPAEWADNDWFEAYDEKSGMRQRYQLDPMNNMYIFKLPAAEEEQHVYVRVVNQHDVPVPGYPIMVQIKVEIKQYVADENGCVELGNLRVGQPFIVASGVDGNLHQDYTVEKGKDEYIFKISEDEGPVVVQLFDKKDTPVPNAQITLTNKRQETFSHYTDQEGCIEVKKSFFTDQEKVKAHIVVPGMKVNDSKFKYSDKYDHYIIHLTDPFPWGCLWRLLLLLLLCLLLLVRCEKDISVIALNGKEMPLPGATVNMEYTEHQLYKDGTFFYNKKHSLMNVTGQDGRCVFEKQPCSVFSWIFYTLQHAYVNGVYGSCKAEGKFLFHWQFKDYPLYFYSDAKIKVVSSRNMQPLPNASVKLWTTDPSCDSLSLTTGNDGMCSFRYSDVSAKVSRLLATCKGYSGALYQDLPMQTFVDSVLIVPLDPPSQCDTQVDNSNRQQGNHAVRDFIMGKNVKGKTFRFDYYTDSAPDHIMIYGGSSEDYSSGKAPLIWQYDGATNTKSFTPQFTVNVTLPCDVVCVVVDRGTNWGYYIHCPQ